MQQDYAALGHYCPFLQAFVHCGMASCTGGLGLACYECEQCPASSTTSECLASGVCVGVSQVCSRPEYSIDKHKDVTERCHLFVSGLHGSQQTGGILTWLCRHGIFYGFDITPNAGKRNDMFRL